MGITHIIGAGAAGLAAAVRLATAGEHFILYEAGEMAGGRCRSVWDAEWDRLLDVGNHLLLGANGSTFDFLHAIGAEHAWQAIYPPVYAFADAKTGDRWQFAPEPGFLPRWIFKRAQRIEGTTARDYLEALRLHFACKNRTVAECLNPSGMLFQRWWRNLTFASCNAPPEEASAEMLWRVVREAFIKRRNGCVPYVVRDSLDAALVRPALQFLGFHGADIRYGWRLTDMETHAGTVQVLHFGGETVPLAAGDSVILALPAGEVTRFLPDTPVPDAYHAILTLHFRTPTLPVSLPPLMGITNSPAQWIFPREGLCSASLYAPDVETLALPDDKLAARIWRDIAPVLQLPADPVPDFRCFRDKHAAFAATPTSIHHRPRVSTGLANLFLAGDYVQTGLPALLESAIKSGHVAATHCIGKEWLGRDA
jgi:squalene-associated FAD-dependent desaturase